MLKQDITYEDLEGNKVTDTFYFHLNKAEAIQVQAMFFGAGGRRLEESVKRQDMVVPVNAILDVILMAYGEKSADGKTFIKNDETRAWFKGTNAYGELVESLSTSEDRLLAFLQVVMPAGFLNPPDQDKPLPPAPTNS